MRLGSRAFDILATLVERDGELVGKDELIARVWPNLFVEEANLKMQVSALRRALGDGQAGNRYIATVPARLRICRSAQRHGRIAAHAVTDRRSTGTPQSPRRGDADDRP